MKFFVLIVLLTVVQAAPPPVPQKAINGSPRTGNDVQKNAASDKADTKAKPIVEGRSAENEAQSANGRRTENAEQSIRVTKFPPVTVGSPRRDWADWGTWAFNLLLAITSGFQMWLLFKTLTFASRQTHEMKRQRIFMGGQLKAMQAQIKQIQDSGEQTDKMIEVAQKSADAAKTSADIAARIAVPTLAIEKFETGQTSASTLEDFLKYPNVNIVVKNCGETAAFLKWWTIVFNVGDLPDTPVYQGKPGCGIVLEKVIIEPKASYALPGLFFPP